MLINHGNNFLEYFLFFHIFDRALVGVEHNVKASGIFYHVNYLLSIIPFSILVFISLVKDAFNFRNLDWNKLFLWIWFITGLIILTIFKTKLEVYVLLILTPSTFLIAKYINELTKSSLREKLIVVFLTLLNILWFASQYERPEIKSYVLNFQNLHITLPLIIVTLITFYFISKFIVNRFSLAKLYYIFIVLFFICLNIYYLFSIPNWENTYEVSSIKKLIEQSGKKKIIYISTNYSSNPQFSFYFNGLNLGWTGSEYSYGLLDTKDGINNLKMKLNALDKNNYQVIVEGDNINRSNYVESDTFIPKDFRFIKKTPGYELYEN